MKKPYELEWRMYGLVPYNLSPIQQGIQFGHAVQEFNNKMIEYEHGAPMGNSFEESRLGYVRDSFDIWRKQHKTFIILNGGTTNNSEGFFGTLNISAIKLAQNFITVAKFKEPDLGDQLTAVVFLVDERVWDKEKYPDRNINPGPHPRNMGDGMSVVEAIYIAPETEEEYEKRLGGKQNVWLREFLSQFRLA